MTKYVQDFASLFTTETAERETLSNSGSIRFMPTILTRHDNEDTRKVKAENQNKGRVIHSDSEHMYDVENVVEI